MNVFTSLTGNNFKVTFSIVMIASLGLWSNCSRRTTLGQQQKYKVILMAGQSNMVGQGKVEDAGDLHIPPNVMYANLNRPDDHKPDLKRFGPEISVFRMLERQFPDTKFIVIKYALSGSSLLDWAPDYDADKAVITGHPQFGNVFNRFFEGVDSIVSKYPSEFLALLWMQGERDARIPEAGKDYYSNFKRFIQAVRSRTDHDLHVLYGLVNPDPAKYPALEIVQSAQREIDHEDSRVYLIETDSLEKWPDKVHYSTAGQLELGSRFSAQLFEIMKPR